MPLTTDQGRSSLAAAAVGAGAVGSALAVALGAEAHLRHVEARGRRNSDDHGLDGGG